MVVENSDQNVQSTRSAGEHPSLNAPQRARSISVDESFKELVNDAERFAPVQAGLDNSMSDSDDDENERIHVNELKSYKPGKQGISRVNSSLSLESFANDGDDIKMQSKQSEIQEFKSKQPEHHSNSPRVQVEAERAASPSVKRKRSSSNVVTADDSLTNQLELERAEFNKRQKSSNGVIRNLSNNKLSQADDPISSPAKSTPTLKAASSTNTPKQHPLSDKNMVEMNPTAEQKANLSQQPVSITDNNLINVRALDSRDDAGSDRFIFFSHRPQRFQFKSNVFLSTLSPFAAVASDMEGVTTKSVCATCGAGGNLLSCNRCPLAFHIKCVNPLRTTPITSSWSCNACTTVNGGDRSGIWTPAKQPKPLPSPNTGFERLIADAKEGNPIDYVLNPSLFRYYKENCGGDWLKCFKCNKFWNAHDGVLSEAIRFPFECRFAFWATPQQKVCFTGSKFLTTESEKIIKAHLRTKSKKRNELFFFGFGEEDRIEYGYKPVDETDEDLIPDTRLQPMEIAKMKQKIHTASQSPSKFNGSVRQPQVMKGSTPTIKRVEPRVSPVTKSAEKPHVKKLEVLTIADDDQPDPPSRISVAKLHKTAPKTISKNVQAYKQKVNDVAAAAQNQVQLNKPQQTVTPPKTNETMNVSTSIAASPATPRMERGKEIQKTTTPSKGNEELEKPEDLQQEILQFIATVGFDVDTEDHLTDLALDNDKSLSRLYLAFRSDKDRFKRHASRLARRSSLPGTDNTNSAKKTEVVQVSPALPQRSIVHHHQIPRQETLQGLTSSHQQQLLTHNQSVPMLHNVQSAPTVTQSAMAQSGVRQQPSYHQLELNERVKQLRLRQLQEVHKLDSILMQEMATAPTAAVPEVHKKQAILRRKLQAQHEEQTKKLVQQYRVSLASQHRTG